MIISGFTRTTSPTQPRSMGSSSPSIRIGSFFLATISWPSLPERPIPLPPCFPMRVTRLELMFPTRTILAISSVSSSVTRRPPTNTDFLPNRAIFSEISGPPPWTTTG